MGTTFCHSQIFFEKNQYYLGEIAKVRIVCDNSQCKKDIKSFKFKLQRHSVGKADGFDAVEAKYLRINKADGIKDGEKCEREIEIQIPMED